MTFSDFMQLVKVLRMLYGINLATLYFEKNIVNFYHFNENDLQALKDSAKL